MFGPGRGAIALSAASQSFGMRVIHERFLPAEITELARLACLEESIAGIPDGSSAHLHRVEDPYVGQRLVEIAFPRIRLVGHEARFEIYVNRDSGAAGARESEVVCGDAVVQVVKNG
jgi:hypothetical protein